MSTPRFLCIATHHKTGTVWMRRTFLKFAEAEGIPFLRMSRPATIAELPEEGPALVTNWSARFPFEMFLHPEARFVHMIRDPRDVLISGARYHVAAPLGNERWLAAPRAALGGKSYQEHIAALPDFAAQLRFEMAGKHAETLTEMLAWPYGHPHVADLRYEDMIEDVDCARFRAALEKLGVAGFDIDRLVESYWTHSLFGGIRDEGARKANVRAHVRSGRKAQWRELLPRAVAEEYAMLYGDALIRLGYARDHGWVEECRGDAEAALAG
ncbi:hypothetical protein OG2516_00979 [Oceanicola granulosus HTCC2516]|uniref:Sulfotransferase domain-containing protein n=1 Tax=Oceanicola granulosus (strain ATCC BAA-861 / DSM 15982 / KCTC 12143 / HTCC2516) TaxID=314256 RepID=Q2CJ44_OCEGH|nr:sulfotransferase domain-containing protein [Oceanicola granulosus]EAR52756.1 hypothetical protein OG2516_00979 [Oceanicola granulosus HTCC2516]